MGTGERNITTLEDIIYEQSPTVDGWICPTCIHYEGGVKCEQGIFITYTRANMKGCYWFELGKECKHCGKRT